jgi:RNA polymerase sigma factor (sigma-70 family)
LATQHSDGELIAACAKGEAWAWDALVDRYKALVYSVALRAGLPEEDAADVFQTAFERLLENLSTIRAPQGLAAWFITTTRREAWRVLRARNREPADPVALDAQMLAVEEAPAARLEESLLADRALVREAMAQLGGRCRELLNLLYFEAESPSYEEISRRLRMPIGSIGPTRARCLQKLREILKRMGMGEA